MRINIALSSHVEPLDSAGLVFATGRPNASLRPSAD